MSEFSPQVLEAAQKLVTKQKAKREKTVENIEAKYPHADSSTLQFDDTTKKYSVEIACSCGETRRVYTSDLFQVRTCTKCADAAKKEKAASKRALLKKAMEAIKAGQVKADEDSE